MFEILGSLVVKGLEKIIDAAVDLEKQSITERRKFFHQLVGLYDSLIDLEEESRKVLKEFLGYATGTVALTRTIPSTYLHRLGDSVRAFRSYLAPISSVIDIYDGELRASMAAAIDLKGRNIEDFEIVVLPYMREAYFMSVPTKQPARNILDRLFKLKWTGALEEYDSEVKEAYGIQRIDLRDRERLLDFLKNCEQALKEIAEVRSKLAAFIRKNFTVDKII